MKEFQTGNSATYDFDIVRTSAHALSANQTFTENNFQLHPYTRLVYVMFLPSHATFVMEERKKPLSGLSQFPRYSTNIKCFYAGKPQILATGFEHFGEYDQSWQWSKMAYYKQLKTLAYGLSTLTTYFPDPTI